MHQVARTFVQGQRGLAQRRKQLRQPRLAACARVLALVLFEPACDGLRSIRYSIVAIQAIEVGTDGLLRDTELLGNALVGEAARDQLGYVDLTRSRAQRQRTSNGGHASSWGGHRRYSRDKFRLGSTRWRLHRRVRRPAANRQRCEGACST